MAKNPPSGEDAKDGPPPSPSPDGGFEMPREEYDLIMECARTGRPIPCAPIVINPPFPTIFGFPVLVDENQEEPVKLVNRLRPIFVKEKR